MINLKNAMFMYDLAARYDKRQSFYGKAKVIGDKDGNKLLYSYDTLVAEIDNDGNGKAKIGGYYSQTTGRHIKEFLKQNGYKVNSWKDIWNNKNIEVVDFENG